MVTYFCPETREQRNVLTVEKASASEVAPLTSGYIMPWMMAARRAADMPLPETLPPALSGTGMTS
jgi:hypothetical protein